ncbi:ferritin family protein [Magnetospirillum sp. UT-4]|uniref:ferritin-like domain-containing protein n=1 Tax=Magnetospirillum sp. UT-4 TaxID=2681467 RepID=UPI001382E8C8|nr:ferritin family protein [Magnetospirillum sp. UT-4]CAA7622213.1 conserved hypothetical protein [Magnetospirillum sp. UT-4]
MYSTLANFLAHAVALETEAGERYRELADVMEVHNNPEVAAMFARMAEFSAMHAAEVTARAGAHGPLPRLKSWEFKWETTEPPEVGDSADTHYRMTPRHALQYALANERRGWEFYNHAATHAPLPEIRDLARDFADEEAEHVRTLEHWLESTPPPDHDWADDPDPANVVD